jgi:hypothetical protein
MTQPAQLPSRRRDTDEMKDREDQNQKERERRSEGVNSRAAGRRGLTVAPCAIVGKGRPSVACGWMSSPDKAMPVIAMEA